MKPKNSVSLKLINNIKDFFNVQKFCNVHVMASTFMEKTGHFTIIQQSLIPCTPRPNLDRSLSKKLFVKGASKGALYPPK